MKKRAACIILLAAMLCTVSCGGKGVSPVTEPTNENTTVSEEVTKAPEIISEALPKADYNDYEFKFLSTDSTTTGYFCYEFDAEQLTGEIMNDAVYERNMAVEDRFNISITKLVSGSYVEQFKSSVMAGEDSYDVLVAPSSTVMQNSTMYGLAVDELPYVDIDRDWWDRMVMEQSALGGRNYALSGDINLIDDDSIWVIYFNKRLAEENKIGDLYKMVYDGKWTLDALRVACADATRDLDGDGTLDYKDQWGLVASSNNAESMLWSGGGMMGKLKSDGSMEITLDSERNINVLSKIYDVFSAKDSVLVIDRDIPGSVGDMNNWTYSYTMFKEGRALFFGYCLYTLPNFRDMEDEFGYLPCPKYDEDQADYVSIAQSWVATSLLVPKSASDPERTSVILEAMASSAQHYITPAYYNVVLTRKYSRDNESSAIIDILRKNRCFDLVYAYNFGGARSINRNLIAESNTIASSIASLKTAVQTAYEDTYQQILDSKSVQ